ncbi:MAG: ferritin-like domain-containing protein [Bradymonadaceae bacterium]|nr:ferritin-like domain-containing protein [Lujinxingiaceae bacterium]
MKKQPSIAFDDAEAQETLISRRDALRDFSATGLGIALAAVPLALGLFSRKAFAGPMPSVTEVLNFALTLEYLEAEFYRLGLEAAVMPVGRDREIFQLVFEHEVAHVALLQDALGADAVAMPTFDFTAGGAFAPFEDYQQFLILAQGFEDTGVRAYKGGAPALIDAADVLTTALQIHSVEARHAAVIRRLRGERGWITGATTTAPANTIQAVYEGEDNTTQGGVDLAVALSQYSEDRITEAFDEPLTIEQVNAIAGMFIVPD